MGNIINAIQRQEESISMLSECMRSQAESVERQEASISLLAESLSRLLPGGGLMNLSPRRGSNSPGNSPRRGRQVIPMGQHVASPPLGVEL